VMLELKLSQVQSGTIHEAIFFSFSSFAFTF